MDLLRFVLLALAWGGAGYLLAWANGSHRRARVPRLLIDTLGWYSDATVYLPSGVPCYMTAQGRLEPDRGHAARVCLDAVAGLYDPVDQPRPQRPGHPQHPAEGAAS